jgi:hypothetical protein
MILGAGMGGRKQGRVALRGFQGDAGAGRATDVPGVFASGADVVQCRQMR